MAGTTLAAPSTPLARRRRRLAACGLGAIALLAFVIGAVVGSHAGGPAPRPATGPGVISQRALADARAYAATRRGRVSFAVVDRGGRIQGMNEDATFISASVVKAMLLIGFLRERARTGRAITPADRLRISQ